MALGSTSVVAPVGSKTAGWQGYAQRIFFVSLAAVAIICIGIVITERRSEKHSDALGGAYYAVTKPPAFNFNRKFITLSLSHHMLLKELQCLLKLDPGQPLLIIIIITIQVLSRTLGSTMAEVPAGMRRDLSRSWLAGTIISCRFII